MTLRVKSGVGHETPRPPLFPCPLGRAFATSFKAEPCRRHNAFVLVPSGA